MGKKKGKTEGGEKKGDDKQNNSNNNKEDQSADGEKKKTGTITVVLKADLHCGGCASKVLKSLRSLQGVESATCGEELNKLTVVGNVDPQTIKEKVQRKTHRMVEIVSPVASKKEKEESGKDNKKTKEKPEEAEKNKKPKEPPVTTAVLKVSLHCEGCIQKIHKVVTKTKGYHELSIDRAKDLVTVKGSMDMKELAETLKKQLKKDVAIVPPKKDSGGEKKEKGGGEQQGKGRGGGAGGDEDVKAMEAYNNMGYFQYGYPNPNPIPPPPMYTYNSGYPVDYYMQAPPQMFSDENPNACSVM